MSCHRSRSGIKKWTTKPQNLRREWVVDYVWMKMNRSVLAEIAQMDFRYTVQVDQLNSKAKDELLTKLVASGALTYY